MLQTQALFDYERQSPGYEQFETLQFGSQLVRICEEQNWTCQISDDIDDWKDVMLAEGGWVNPTFDPEKSEVDRTNTACVVIREANGRFVACNAVRIFFTDSFREVMASGELFYGRGIGLFRQLPLILPDDFTDISGRIGYSGGTLISPRHRGKKLGLLTTRLVRVLAERLFRANHHAGHIFQNRPDDPCPQFPYHFLRCVPCMPHLRIPDREQDQLLFLVDISRTEFLAQVRRNVRQLVREGNQTLDDLALLAP